MSKKAGIQPVLDAIRQQIREADELLRDAGDALRAMPPGPQRDALHRKLERARREFYGPDVKKLALPAAPPPEPKENTRREWKALERARRDKAEELEKFGRRDAAAKWREWADLAAKAAQETKSPQDRKKRR
jgi:hypothetical protein